METFQPPPKASSSSASSTSKTTIIALSVCCLCIVIALIVSITVITTKSNDSSSSSPCKIIYHPRPNCTDHCSLQFASYINSTFINSKSWNESTSEHYLRTFPATALGQCITKINTSQTCELRPDPSCYLPPNVIDFHLDLFRSSGVSSIVGSKWPAIDNFSVIGRPSQPQAYDIHGVEWVSPYSVQQQLLTSCATASEPENCVLLALGVEINEWDMFQYDWGNPTLINRVIQTVVFPEDLEVLHLRIPSGNEEGANELWRPGGYTIDGDAEALVDQISRDEYCWIAVATPNGTYCYPNCQVECAEFKGCEETNCDYSATLINIS